MSGLGSGQGMEQSNQACPRCGSSSCNCDQMDEAYGNTAETQNSPDYPTNTETSGNAMQYSGGIDGPKSTGQATVPVLSSQEERQGVAEEIIGQPEFEHTGNAGYGSYGAAEYTATTKHRVGSHAYEVTTEQDGDGDFSYFIYENGKEIFSSIQPSNKNQLGHRISSALLDEHKKATAHLFDSDEDEYDLEEQGIGEAKSGWNSLSDEGKESGTYQKSHATQLAAAQAEMDRRRNKGEDMTGAKIDNYKIVKPKKKDVAEDGHEDMNGAPASGAVHYNVGKLSKEIGTDPRQLKIAIQRSITGNPTRQDTLTVANAFISILKTGDDQTIQNIANIIKAGNPRKDSAQESTTTKEIKVEKVHEEINTEAYDRLRKVFDFSNYKG